MRVIEKIEVSKLKYGCVVVTQNFLFNYSLFKIILNPSKKVEFSSENQKDMSVDGNEETVTLTLRNLNCELRYGHTFSRLTCKKIALIVSHDNGLRRDALLKNLINLHTT